MNDRQEHQINGQRIIEEAHAGFGYLPWGDDDPGDCDRIVSAEVPEAPPEGLMDPVMAPVRKN